MEFVNDEEKIPQVWNSVCSQNLEYSLSRAVLCILETAAFFFIARFSFPAVVASAVHLKLSLSMSTEYFYLVEGDEDEVESATLYC